MALADYFSKNLLAISQVLQRGSSGQFQSVLNNTVIGIAFDDEVKKHEGRAALDLSVRLIARLYPTITFIALGKSSSTIVEEFSSLAKAINSKIEISNDSPTLVIVVGATTPNRSVTSGPMFFIGSDGWLSKFSTNSAIGCGDSSNPLGAGIATCIAVSNAFRYVFSDFLTPEYDDDFVLSLLSLDTDETGKEIKEKKIDLGKIQLAGFGAIGNGFMWALGNSPLISGTITVVEPQEVALSNLQRYILAEEKHIDKPKTEIAKEWLKNSKFSSVLHESSWAEYLNIGNSWKNETAVIAIDNAIDRIGIQSSLPKTVYNGYTESNVLGVSRHTEFGKEACVVCTYMPSGKRKSRSQEIADNLNLSQMERLIRDYVFYEKVADDQLLGWIAQANQFDIADLQKFKGMPINEFYSNVVCGGILMELRNGDQIVEHIEAPLAFQSAMAGILEFSELVIEKGGLRKKTLPNQTQFYPLASVKSGVNPYNHTIEKDSSGRCICADPDFVIAYKRKWSNIPI